MIKVQLDLKSIWSSPYLQLTYPQIARAFLDNQKQTPLYIHGKYFQHLHFLKDQWTLPTVTPPNFNYLWHYFHQSIQN